MEEIKKQLQLSTLKKSEGGKIIIDELAESIMQKLGMLLYQYKDIDFPLSSALSEIKAEYDLLEVIVGAEDRYTALKEELEEE